MIPDLTSRASDRGYIVRRAQTSDIEAVLQLSEITPMAARWSTAAYDAYCLGVRADDSAQVKALLVAGIPIAFEPTPMGSALISHPASETIIGFAAFSAIPKTHPGECELENMAVAEEWRRHGVGGRLLAAGLLWCRAWGIAAMAAESGLVEGTASGSGLWLEVRASNHGAIAFYEHTGFRIAGRRPAYYAEPVEDAILMQKE